MGIKGQDAISCRGGLGVHVTRGERRILEMELHLKCMREKLTMLETMLPSSVTNLKKLEGEPETSGQEECSNLSDKKIDEEEQMCVLQSLAIKEKKLRDEIFNMECKEKEYLSALSKVKINQSNKEEIKKLEGDNDATRAGSSLKSRKEQNDKKKKISQLEEYTKKLCDCLRSIQNNRKELSQEAEYLSKEINGYEDDSELKEFWGFFKPERNQEKGNECPCGKPAKCNSCTVCTCSDWEQDLEIGGKEKPEEPKESKLENIKLVRKKNHCRCFQSSSDSIQSSQSLEINDIYNCSISKMQSEMSIATTSIPSTVEDVIIGDEKDKEKFCCLCSPEDDCQKFCEICLCEWEREYRTNQQLYLDDYDTCDMCEICNQERFRGGTDLGIPTDKELCNKSFKESLPNIVKQLIPEYGEKMKEEILYDSKNVPSSVDTSQLSKNLQIEELRINLQNLQNRNNALRKWPHNRNYQINVNSSKDNIIAALIDEIKQNPISNRPKIWKKPQEKKVPDEEMLTKNLTIGLFVLLLTFSSHLLGFNGIFSLSLVVRFLFQIISFPFQTCIQIYRYFPILYGPIREYIFNYSEVFLNNFQNKNAIENHKFGSFFIFTRISAFFGLILFLLILGTSIRFLCSSTVNCSSSGKFSDSQLRIIVSSAVKKTMFLVRPIIFLLIFIKSVLLFSLALSTNLINFCVPRKFKNFSYRLMNSFIDMFWILFTRKFINWCISNFVYIIFGFLVNKMWNLDEAKIDLGFLRLFFNGSLCETSEFDQSKNLMDDSISEWFKPSSFFSFLNVTVENIFEFARLIFRSFEIK